MRTFIYLLMVTCFVGCGRKNDAKGDAGDGQPQAEKPKDEKEPKKSAQPGVMGYNSVTVPANLEPADVVARFLEALRVGNDVEAEALLTDEARRATTESDYSVRPTPSPSSQYRVGKTEYSGKGMSHVSCAWTQSQNVTETTTYNIIWRLKRQKSGWRISGFSPEVEPEVYTYLDFERPEEMMREFERVEARLARREKARKPASTNSPVRQATLPALGPTYQR